MKFKHLKIRCFLSLSLMLPPLLTGCELPTAVEEDETKVEVTPLQTVPDDASPVTGTVCNPFGGGSVGRNQGLKGELYHLPETLPRYGNVESYLQNGSKVEATLFFDQINIPTRPFDKGFSTTEGQVLRTPSGDTLYEWFALRFDSVLKLTAQDRPGRIQLGLLSDDGAVLRGKVNGAWQTLVDNDGTHATRFKIGRTPLDMGIATELPLDFRYFQGPRMHIAAMILWREWPEEAGAWLDPLEGAAGNDLFFDSNQTPSAPRDAYHQLLARGWKPVPAANFFLPAAAPSNPCPETPDLPTDEEETEEPAPIGNIMISGFDGTTTATTAFLIWQTPGYASTTKVYWGTSPANLVQEVELGTSTTIVHQIEIRNLSPLTTYYFRAESTDANGNTVSSGVIQKKTK
jgi:hypothetical protein